MKGMICILLFVFSGLASAIDTNDYEKIIELKAWTTTIDIHLESGQKHQCSGGHKSRFLVQNSNEQHVTFALAAFMAEKSVRLQYKCSNSGFPIIQGIRVR